MHESSAAFRKIAEACRRYAKDAKDDRDKTRWLRIAEKCMVLSREAAGANILTATARIVLGDKKASPRGIAAVDRLAASG